MTIEDFILPFEGELKADNRWVKMAEIIPWDESEQEYAKLFKKGRNDKDVPPPTGGGKKKIKNKGKLIIDATGAPAKKPEPATALSIYLYIILILKGFLGLLFIIDWKKILTFDELQNLGK